MAIKELNYNKLDSPFPIRQTDKGLIQRIPLSEAFGNAKKIVAPRINNQPVPTSGTFNSGHE